MEHASKTISLGFFFAIGWAVFGGAAGCSPSGTVSQKDNNPPGMIVEDPVKQNKVHTGRGSYSAYSKEVKREMLYKIDWQSADIEVDTTMEGQTQQYQAKANKVAGILMKKGIPTSHFSADTALINRDDHSLSLQGNVQVNSLVEKTQAKCDRVDYSDLDQIIKASGDVSVIGNGYTAGKFPRIWLSSDLSEIATPDQFSPIRHTSISKTK